MPHLSTMLGKRIEDVDGSRIGRLHDVVASPGVKFPVVNGIIVESGRGRKRRLFFVPWSEVRDFASDRFVITSKQAETPVPDTDIFLARDLLDKQIVDMEGHKIVRVNDVRMARTGRELRVMGADVGALAILRRLGLVPVAQRLQSEHAAIRSERLVPFNLISSIGPQPYDLKLNVPLSEFLKVHPSDIADIIEQLDVDQRSKIMALIDDPKLAEVLTHVLPVEKPSVAEAIGDERLSDLLEIMPPDEAADILGVLPRGKAQTLMSLMEIEEAGIVGELLGYEPDTAGGRMTTEFVSIPDSMTSEETIEYLRDQGLKAETIYYIYVVDSEGHLSGVLSLRDLLTSRPDKVVSEIMMRDIVTVDLEEDQEVVADRLSKYNLLALPVVDEDHVLKGIVTVDDVIDVVMEESTEDFSEVSGVSFEEAPAGEAIPHKRWVGTSFTFLGGILATALFGVFKSDFTSALALVYFVPLVLRASHDVSIWSLAVAVRHLRNMDSSGTGWGRVIAREYANTLVAAVLISAFGLAIGVVWTGFQIPAVAGTAGLFVGIALAGILGLAIPVMIRRTRFEHAAGKGRLLGVIVMAASVVSFLSVSGLIVRAWG